MSNTNSRPNTQPRIDAIRVEHDLNSVPNIVHIDLHVSSDLCYFEGHFPGCPLLPGVVQIHWAMQFGRLHFALPARFNYLSKIKFMRVIAPGSPATLTLKFPATSSELSFEYRVVDALCSSGNIGFV